MGYLQYITATAISCISFRVGKMADTKSPARVDITDASPSSDGGLDHAPTNSPENRSHKRSTWRRLVGYFWDSVDGDPRDRRYIQKLDTFLL